MFKVLITRRMKHLFDLLSVYVFPIQNSIYLFIEYTICTANAYSYFGGKTQQ